MYVLKNLTQTELAYYTAQPTAAKLLDKTRRDADYVPAGDKDTAAVYVAERDAEKATAKNGDSGVTNCKKSRKPTRTKPAKLRLT